MNDGRRAPSRRPSFCLQFLFHTLATASVLDGRDVLNALRIYRQDETVRQQVHDTVMQRADAALIQSMEQHFKVEWRSSLRNAPRNDGRDRFVFRDF